jgi:hypothetical protein
MIGKVLICVLTFILMEIGYNLSGPILWVWISFWGALLLWVIVYHSWWLWLLLLI